MAGCLPEHPKFRLAGPEHVAACIRLDDGTNRIATTAREVGS
jgi:hypothetical protein